MIAALLTGHRPDRTGGGKDANNQRRKKSWRQEMVGFKFSSLHLPLHDFFHRNPSHEILFHHSPVSVASAGDCALSCESALKFLWLWALLFGHTIECLYSFSMIEEMVPRPFPLSEFIFLLGLMLGDAHFPDFPTFLLLVAGSGIGKWKVKLRIALPPIWKPNRNACQLSRHFVGNPTLKSSVR